MKTFGMIHTDNIKGLAGDLDLPEWLVEALIIEYLPCRRFLENDTLVLIDFNTITAQDISQIPKPYVILNGIFVVHNIAPNVLSDRKYVNLLRLPMLAADEAIFVPQGKISPVYLVPEYSDITDWKMESGTFRTLIIEENSMFQWKAIDDVPEDASQEQDTSEVYSDDQLKAVNRIRDKFYANFAVGSFPADAAVSSKMREELKTLYEDLEILRVSMRQTVLEYHNLAKQKPEALSSYTEDPPPLTTIFDETIVKNGSFEIRSYIEPLFFRAAHRAAKRAENASVFVKGRAPSTLAISEEIEAAAESLVLSAMCLEAYINGFAQDHLSHIWTQDVERMEAAIKWLIIPVMLGNPNCFSKDPQPYQDFMMLIRWRNNYLAHYKHKFQSPDLIKDVGAVSKIYAICNAENAKKAIDIVRRMIERLHESLNLQTPSWVRNTGMWLSPVEIDLDELTFGYTDNL